MKSTDQPSPVVPCASSAVLRGAMMALLLSVIAGFCVQAASAQAVGYTGIFGGGPFYKNPAAITEIETSGFTEAIVWSVEVNSSGDLNFNGEFPLTSAGVYVGNQSYPNFPAQMAQLKQGTVKRVTFSIGSSNFGDWENITALVQSQGTGPNSILYKDFAALKAAIPALDALDFDDENSYNDPTTVQFAAMVGQLGYKVMPDPYVNNSYWINLVSQINTQLPGTVDGVHLQAYAGGQGNSPCVDWNFGSVPVFPGLWDKNDTPAQVQTIMTGWHDQCGIIGGFMWLYDDFVGTGLAAQYAAAINTAVGNGSGGSFTLSGPGSVYLNQSGTANAVITITDENGFTGQVTLSLSTLPKGVTAKVVGTGNTQKIVFGADSTAATGFYNLTVTGTSGSIVQNLPLALGVSAALGHKGGGVPVDLSSEFDTYGAYLDGKTYTTGGLDGLGYSYSANLITGSRVLDGVLFDFGSADIQDAATANGQTISLNPGKYKYRALALVGTGINGNQISQALTVTYTDGTTSKFIRSFSDWYTPQQYPGEYEAIAMPYRNYEDGTEDMRPFNLYAYPLPLNSSKIVESVTLPDNADVKILSATLVP
ncbi:MAG: hypothetical protein ABSE92_02905 [Terriglobales bacterium]